MRKNFNLRISGENLLWNKKMLPIGEMAEAIVDFRVCTMVLLIFFILSFGTAIVFLLPDFAILATGLAFVFFRLTYTRYVVLKYRALSGEIRTVLSTSVANRAAVYAAANILNRKIHERKKENPSKKI